MARKFAILLALVTVVLGLLSCEKFGNSPPYPAFSSFPDYGDRETVFIFDASESFDDETDNWRLKVRWDAQDDGVWDSEYAIEKRFGCQYQTEGMHIVRLEVLDAFGGLSQTTDTIIVSPVIKDSVFIDPRDGKTYQITRLWGTWWMAENLRYGEAMQTHGICTDNKRVEYFLWYDTESQSQKAYYTWNEASDYQLNPVQGICPDGWRLMTYHDVMELKELTARIRNKYSYIGNNGNLHLNFGPDGRYYWPGDQWDDVQVKGYYWIQKEGRFPQFSNWIYLNQSDTLITRSEYSSVSWVNRWHKEWHEFTFSKLALPVRCIRD